MLYRTIKAKRFYHHLFDIETGLYYSIVNHSICGNYGYFMIKQYDNDKWELVRELRMRDIEAEEVIKWLPLFTKIKLYNFFILNYSDYKSAQKYISLIASLIR